MSTINNEFEQHKVLHYDGSEYKQISPWLSSQNIERKNGTIVEDELNRIETLMDSLIDDTDEGAPDTTWSSEKIDDVIDNLPKIDDNNYSTTSLWSSQKSDVYRQQTKTIGPESSYTFTPRFQGFFAIVRRQASMDGIIGIMDHTGAITYLRNDYYHEETDPQSGETIIKGFANITVSGNTVTVYNRLSNYHIIVYYFKEALS